MELAKINPQVYTTAAQKTEAPKEAKPTETKNNTAAETDAKKNVDTFAKSTSNSYAPAYSKENASKATTNKDTSNVQFTKKTALQIKNESMLDLVSKVLGKQGTNLSGKLSLSDFPAFKGTAAEGAFFAAESAVKDTKDYWGAEATSERIFTFAKTLAGDDPDMFDTMKKAFLKGYSQAVGTLGGSSNLPSVTTDTYNRVMDKFNSWEKELNSSTTKTDTE